MNVTTVSAELTSWWCHLANKAGNVWHRRVSAIKLKQGIHRHQNDQPPPRYRHTSPYGPLRPNVVSSTKPEIHDVSQRRQRRTEPRPQGICTTTFVKISPAVPEICLRICPYPSRWRFSSFFHVLVTQSLKSHVSMKKCNMLLYCSPSSGHEA